jgi:hypothetical protein
MAMTLLSTTASPLLAQDIVFKGNGSKATLVELFSSEGCSSCPPAEAWVSKLKDSPRLWNDLFPVVFHVDYWDGLGWPDRFASPDYTQRQRTYAARLGQDSVYTPEFVTNGREWRGWFHGEALPSTQAGTSGALTVSSSGNGKKISVAYAPVSADSAPAYTVNVALLGANVISDVGGGENGGRQLQHDFVVLGFASQPLAGKDQKLESGDIALTSSIDTPAAAVIAWISTEDGSLVQIAGGWLRSSSARL